MQKAEETFRIWFIQPINALRLSRGSVSGDGTFIAFATCFFLYERYAMAVLKKSKQEKAEFYCQIASDFNTDQETAKAFWIAMRHGILHQGMPVTEKRKGEQKPYKWKFNDNYFRSVELEERDGVNWLKINPWRIIDNVISLWERNLNILEESINFPWAEVYQDEVGDSNSIVTGAASGLTQTPS